MPEVSVISMFSLIRKRIGCVRWRLRTSLSHYVDNVNWWRVRCKLALLSPDDAALTRITSFAEAFQTTAAEIKRYADEISADSRFLDEYNVRLQALPPELRKPTSPLEDCVTIYVAVRVAKPETMVETGVHCGGLTSFALRAMDRNGRGVLYSIDKPMPHLPPFGEPNGQGCLVPPELHGQWHLINGDSERDLPLLLTDLGAIDFFNHDSLHTFDFMTMEYELVWPHLRPGGVLMSHDVRINHAFRAFARRHQHEVGYQSTIYGMGMIRKRNYV